MQAKTPPCPLGWAHKYCRLGWQIVQERHHNHRDHKTKVQPMQRINIVETHIWVAIVARTSAGRAHYNFDIICWRPAHSLDLIVVLDDFNSSGTPLIRSNLDIYDNHIWNIYFMILIGLTIFEIYILWFWLDCLGEKPSTGVETAAASIIAVVWILSKIVFIQLVILQISIDISVGDDISFWHPWTATDRERVIIWSDFKVQSNQSIQVGKANTNIITLAFNHTLTNNFTLDFCHEKI